MQARLHRHRFNPPLLSHITVIHPEIHAGHRIDTLPQELQHVPDLLDVMLQCFPFPVRCQFAGHEHPDLCLISIHAGIHQLCVLFLDHFSVKIQIQDIPEVFQLFRIQMRRHFCEHILDDFFYHNKPLLYTDIVKDRGLLCQLLTQLYSDLNATNNNLSNTNSRLDTSLSSSVLDYALTLPEGMHTVRFPGDGYTGADTPNSYYRYSSATIIVRSKGKIVTVLLYGISTKAPLAVNSYDGGKWNGWDQYVTKNDLLISASGTGPTDWTALETVENMPFKIWNVTKASTSKGAPAGCYDYGTLIALVATATGDRWRNTLIYLPDNNNNVGNKVYVRSGISTKWLAISGTDVNSVS